MTAEAAALSFCLHLFLLSDVSRSSSFFLHISLRVLLTRVAPEDHSLTLTGKLTNCNAAKAYHKYTLCRGTLEQVKFS